MTVSAKLSKDGKTFVVQVPMTFRKRGGRKLIVVPEGASWASQRTRVDNAMVKALARAFRWRKLLESGIRASVEEIAAAEGINASYVSRIIRLTLLAPEIVEASSSSDETTFRSGSMSARHPFACAFEQTCPCRVWPPQKPSRDGPQRVTFFRSQRCGRYPH